MEFSQLYAATLTHYSTEPLTTGPDYDPLLLLLALAGDVHPNPGPSRYPCSVCFKNVTSQGTSYLCTRCSHWVHSRCSGLRNAADYRKANGWICTACMTPPRPRTPSPPPSPAHMPTMSDKTFNILQWNANGIGNKQTELSIFLEAHNVKVAAIQESKLTAKSRSPNIQNYTLVRHDRRQGPGGGLLFFIHNSVSFTRKSLSTTSKNDPHLEELTISITMDNTELLITNVYIPPASSCNGRYSPPIDHLLTGTDSLVLGDFNAHHSLWHSGTTDSRGNQLADSVSISSFAVLNTDSPTRLPGNADPSSPDVSLASASLITSSEWQTHTTMSSDHLPILIGLQTTATSSPARHRTYINLKKADWTGYMQEIERKLSSRHLPTDCQKDEKLFRATLLKAASHHIPTGRRKLYTQQVPAEILAMMEERDDLRKQDPASPRLSTMNDEITKATSDHKRRQWREFVESIDHRTDSSKLWRTIKGIDGKSKQTAENEGITFTGRSHTSPKLIANSFNRQFTTSKLGKHSSSRRTRHVSKDVKRMSLEQAESFTSDQVTSAIKSCRSSRVYGPDTLSIFHLKNLGPLATEHLTALYNDSLKSCRLPSIWKTSLVFPIPKPGKDSSQGTSYRPISLLCPAAKVLEALILPSINEFLSPAKDQHGFRPRHSTTSALLQLTTDIETGFNQRKPPHRTVCVAIDLTAAFDTVSHDTLISKIVGSSLPPAITRWLSCYLRGRQAATSFRGTKSSTRIVRTGVPQGSKLSPSLFNYYIADMPRPTPPVKRVCYADDITVWATGPKIPQLESMINNYLRDVSIYLKDNSLLISAPKSTVTLFTPDKHQFQMHPDIILEATQLPLERSPKILGVIMDPSISFHKHCNYVADRIDKRNNMLKALAGSSWGQNKETLLMTYNALGKSIANYAAPVWSTNASDSSFKKIQTAQNAALRTATGAHKMASIDHLHQESLTLRVKDHSDMLSAQYLVNCLEEDHVSHGITIQEPRPRPMKETLHSRHLSTVLPRLGSNRMESLQNLHTHAVDSAIQLQGNNRVLKKRPPPISDEEQRLNRRQRCTLSQLRSGHCHLLQDYKHRVFGEPSDICTDCGASPQDVRHLFACTTHPTDLSPEDLWRNPVRSIRAFSYLDNGNLD